MSAADAERPKLRYRRLGGGYRRQDVEESLQQLLTTVGYRPGHDRAAASPYGSARGRARRREGGARARTTRVTPGWKPPSSGPKRSSPARLRNSSRDGHHRIDRRAAHDDVGPAARPHLHARDDSDRLRPRPRPARGVPVHARRLPDDVPRPPVDDAAVRRLRHGRGDERALPLPARPRPDGPLDGVRHADAHGLRLRPRALARRGRPRGRRHRLARRHGDALRAASRSARSRRR